MLFTWPPDNTQEILNVDIFLLSASLIILCIAFFVHCIKIFRKSQNKKMNYRKISKILIHVFIFIRLFWRTKYLCDSIQTNNFDNKDAILPVFSLLFTIIRMTIFAYFILLAGIVFNYLSMGLQVSQTHLKSKVT